MGVTCLARSRRLVWYIAPTISADRFTRKGSLVSWTGYRRQGSLTTNCFVFGPFRVVVILLTLRKNCSNFSGQPILPLYFPILVKIETHLCGRFVPIQPAPACRSFYVDRLRLQVQIILWDFMPMDFCYIMYFFALI